MAEQNTLGTLDFILPCYNEGDFVNLMISNILSLFKEFQVSILLIDDGSTTALGSILTEENRRNDQIQLYRHIENQGLEAAIFTGLVNSKAERIIVMDSDGQDPLPNIYNELKKVARFSDTLINMVRSDRRYDSFLKTYSAKIYYFLVYVFSLGKYRQGSANFCCVTKMHKSKILALMSRGYHFRNTLDEFDDVRIAYYSRQKRVQGDSKYSWLKLINQALVSLGFIFYNNKLLIVLGIVSLNPAIMVSCLLFDTVLFFNIKRKKYNYKWIQEQ